MVKVVFEHFVRWKCWSLNLCCKLQGWAGEAWRDLEPRSWFSILFTISMLADFIYGICTSEVIIFVGFLILPRQSFPFITFGGSADWSRSPRWNLGSGGGKDDDGWGKFSSWSCFDFLAMTCWLRFEVLTDWNRALLLLLSSSLSALWEFLLCGTCLRPPSSSASFPPLLPSSPRCSFPPPALLPSSALFSFSSFVELASESAISNYQGIFFPTETPSLDLDLVLVVTASYWQTWKRRKSIWGKSLMSVWCNCTFQPCWQVGHRSQGWSSSRKPKESSAFRPWVPTHQSGWSDTGSVCPSRLLFCGTSTNMHLAQIQR